MPPRRAVVLLDRSEPAWKVSAVRAVRRLTQLRCWVVPGRDSSSSTALRSVPSEESRPSTPRYGFAVVIPACYSSTPPPGRIPPEVFRAGRRQPSRLLAQTLSVLSTAAPFPKLPKTAPVRQCQAFGRECCTFDPAMGRPGPGPGGRLPPLRAGLFRCSREPVVSLPRRSRARRPHLFQTASGATLHSLRSFRALWHWQTHRRRTWPPPQSSRLRDCQHHRPTRSSRPGVSAISTVLPRPNGWKG